MHMLNATARRFSWGTQNENYNPFAKVRVRAPDNESVSGVALSTSVPEASFGPSVVEIPEDGGVSGLGTEVDGITALSSPLKKP